MEKRQETLLKLVVENYIETAEPVGSRFLLSESSLDCGEATVRNELRALEEEGYLTHPHTSAGRIPTEKGYQYYLSQISWDKINVAKKDFDFLQKFVHSLTGEEKIKSAAKSLAELANAAVLVAFDLDRVYYTGLSNLFNQPEFKELNLVVNVSSVFDRCEECLENFSDQVDDEVHFYLGDSHPFGNFLSVAACRLGKNSFLALLGPVRMDYKRNFALMNKIKELI